MIYDTQWLNQEYTLYQRPNWPLSPLTIACCSPGHQLVSRPRGLMPGVQGLSLCHSDQWSPLSPMSEFRQNKISFPPSSGVVWCVLRTSQAINLYWIYHDNCRPPRWVNIKIYLPTTITRDFYHDHWQLRLSCQRLHLSPDSRTLSRASYCLCDAVQRMASVIFMPESVSLFSSHQFTFP